MLRSEGCAPWGSRSRVDGGAGEVLQAARGVGVWGSKALVFMMEGRPRVLDEREVEKVVKGLEALCRDVVD